MFDASNELLVWEIHLPPVPAHRVGTDRMNEWSLSFYVRMLLDIARATVSS